MSEESYEFTPEQNELIADLARKMLTVGVFLYLIGGGAAVGFLWSAWSARMDAALGLILLAAFCLAVATWTVMAGRSFRKIVDTEGHDIPHTMAALAQLRRFYTLHFWLIVLYLILIALAIVGVPGGLG
ncbi:MAG: hypothetical protein GY719_39570 [bacterium]|nr:hypothetical protein [bacterium]